MLPSPMVNQKQPQLPRSGISHLAIKPSLATSTTFNLRLLPLNFNFSNSKLCRSSPIVSTRKQTTSLFSNSQLLAFFKVIFFPFWSTPGDPLTPPPSSPASPSPRLTPPKTGCYSPLFAITGEITLRYRGFIWMLPLALLASFASGCAVSKKTVVKPSEAPGPLMTATKADLTARYNQLAAAVTSINATVSMKLTAGSAYSGVIEQYHEVNGFILASVPANIRVIGQAPVVGKNIFDMVSDGKTFEIFIPSKNKFLVGSAELNMPAKKPIENLRPQHLVDALLWLPIQEKTTVLFEEANEAAGRYYVLTVVFRAIMDTQFSSFKYHSDVWEIRRKIWFDRSDLNVVRLESYAFFPEGQLDSDVHYSDWQPAGATTYPRQITISRPGDDYKLEISIKKLTLNETIAPDRFVLQQPPGTELVHVGEDTDAPRPTQPKPAAPNPMEPKPTEPQQ
jgi:outer membrane lipoprotein-sorting protein